MNEQTRSKLRPAGRSRRPERRQLLERFQEMAAKRVPIIGGGAGTGLSAKCEEAGGIALLVI